MELIDRGNHFYFEMVGGYGEEYLIDYEFNFNYIRYICRTDYSYCYKYDLYQNIIDKLLFLLGGVDSMDYLVYYCIGDIRGIDKGYVPEVIGKSGLYKYYVLHKVNELDNEIINSVNKYKYNLNMDNINVLNYYDKYWGVMEEKSDSNISLNNDIDKSIKFEIINDDSLIRDIF